VKAPELHCTFHQGVTCMANGTLHLVQMVLPGTEGYDGSTVVPVGSFCTISALMAWCDRQGAIPGARPGDLRARRPGGRAHRDQRPTVEQATRRPRKSLSPKEHT
jgi:hypothetical protein